MYLHWYLGNNKICSLIENVAKYDITFSGNVTSDGVSGSGSGEDYAKYGDGFPDYEQPAGRHMCFYG